MRFSLAQFCMPIPCKVCRKGCSDLRPHWFECRVSTSQSVDANLHIHIYYFIGYLDVSQSETLSIRLVKFILYYEKIFCRLVRTDLVIYGVFASQSVMKMCQNSWQISDNWNSFADQWNWTRRHNIWWVFSLYRVFVRQSARGICHIRQWSTLEANCFDSLIWCDMKANAMHKS